MTINSRPYGRETDLRRMMDFLVAARSETGHCGYIHVGDLTWWMFQNTVFDPVKNVRLWEGESDELLGFVWFNRWWAEFQIHPRLRGSGALEELMLAWAEERARQAMQDGEEPRPLIVGPLEDDDRFIAFLERRGFERSDPSFSIMLRDLNAPIPEIALPDGVTIRHVAGEAEFEERVSIHREVWEPSKITLEAYRRLRSAPAYDPELDLVAADSEGAFLSYCICWLDAVNKSGEFEPVGTRTAHRGLGLGQAVMREGMRRLKARGAKTAFVYSEAKNHKFYESVGFRVINRYVDYKKQLK